MKPAFKLGRKTIGLDHPTYFVADVAANHDGDLDRAVHLVHLAAEAGADAAKFQNFKAETIVSDRGFSQLGTKLSHQANWPGSVFEVYRQAALPLDWTETLASACNDAGIDYFTAPYDLDLIPLLDRYVCAWKVGSGDITWPEAIEAMARTGKPLLIATGASDMDDVRRAVRAASATCSELVVMQCNTNYANQPDNFNHIELNVITTFAREFPDVVLGLSDHTPGCTTVLGAVTLGARVIEKHLTDDQTRTGPDHAFSMTPVGWRDMVDRTRELESALGTGVKRVMANEAETVVVQRRAIRARHALEVGTVLGPEDLDFLRPCPEDGLAPYRVSELVGRRVRQPIAAGDLVRLADVG